MPGCRCRDVGGVRPLAGERPSRLRILGAIGLGGCGSESSTGDVENVVWLAAAIQKSVAVGRSSDIGIPRTWRRRRPGFPTRPGSELSRGCNNAKERGT